jgi:pimeloyl-ACP methyl ester carboxylesterase
VKANVNYILRHTGEKDLLFIGHSQGAAQGLMAFSRDVELQQKITLFIAMSPGAFVQPFPSRPLRSLAPLYGYSPLLYFAIFGKGVFLPFMETLRKLVPTHVFTYFAFCMFKHLMHWHDENWDKDDKPQYFSEAPAGSSTRTLAQWFQHSLSGKFSMYDFGNPTENKKRYGQESAPEYPLCKITIPVAVIAGGLDTLLDYKRLISELPNCIFQKCIPHHAHLDNLMAIDAHTLVYPDIIELLRQYPKTLDSISSQSRYEEKNHKQNGANGTNGKKSKRKNG